MLGKKCVWDFRVLTNARLHLLSVMYGYVKNGTLWFLQIILLTLVEILFNIQSIKVGSETALDKTREDLYNIIGMDFGDDITKLNDARNTVTHELRLSALNSVMRIFKSWGLEKFAAFMQYILGDSYDDKIILAFWGAVTEYKRVNYNKRTKDLLKVAQEDTELNKSISMLFSVDEDVISIQ